MERKKTNEIIEFGPHTPGATNEENRIAPTCAKAGSYEIVTYCKVCSKEASREKKEIPALEHVKGNSVKENQKVQHNFAAGFAPVEARLVILSALEEIALKESRSVMLIADGGGSFLGAKFSYFSEDEHTFMGFGGFRYMEVNYTDAEWADFVAQNSNDLSAEYKKSE